MRQFVGWYHEGVRVFDQHENPFHYRSVALAMSKRLRRLKRDEAERQRRRTAPGAMPGTIQIDPHAPPSVVKLMAYSPGEFREVEIQQVDEIRNYLAKYPVTWINVDGLGGAEILRGLGDLFQLHPLALEDVVNVHQRSKIEHYVTHEFLVFHQVELRHRLITEQISLFLGKNYVLTFQEEAGDCLDPVRDRIRQSKGRIREWGPDYLAYAILDASVDHYFPVLEEFGERLETLETQIIESPETSTMTLIHDTKRQLLTLRRKIWPLRDALNTLIRDAVPLISDNSRVYLRDTHDHVLRIIDLIETYRELGSDLLEFQLSSVSYKINEVMRILTVIATIFIPLTFIVGLYGMNFDPNVSPWNMPELKWYYGYPFALTLMALVTGGLLLFFYRLGWMTTPKTARPFTVKDIPAANLAISKSNENVPVASLVLEHRQD